MITSPQVSLNNKFTTSSTIIFLASKNVNCSFAHGQNKTENLVGNTIVYNTKSWKSTWSVLLSRMRGKKKASAPPWWTVLFIHSVRSYYSDYPTIPIPNNHTHFTPFLHSARMYLISFNQLSSAPEDAPLVERWYDFPQKTEENLEAPKEKSVLRICFPPSSFGRWQVATKTIGKSKSFSGQTNSKRGKTKQTKNLNKKEKTYNKTTQTNKHKEPKKHKNPEKYWKLKNNHFRRRNVNTYI